MEFRVRRATSEDAADIVHMMVEMREVEMMRGKTGYVEDDVEFVKAAFVYLDEIMKDEEGYVVIVAVDEAREDRPTIGCAICEMQALETMFDPCVQGNILMMVVKNGYKRTGIGGMMLEALESVMRKVGVKRMVATCYQGNVNPQWGLLKHGYKYEYVILFKEIGEE